MPVVQLHSGTFNLPPAPAASVSFVLTLTGGAGGGTIAVTDPDGNPWLAANLGVTDAFTLSGIGRADLKPGQWTVAVTGNITGSITRT